jgi:hypothetical protein
MRPAFANWKIVILDTPRRTLARQLSEHVRYSRFSPPGSQFRHFLRGFEHLPQAPMCAHCEIHHQHFDPSPFVKTRQNPKLHFVANWDPAWAIWPWSARFLPSGALDSRGRTGVNVDFGPLIPHAYALKAREASAAPLPSQCHTQSQ